MLFSWFGYAPVGKVKFAPGGIARERIAVGVEPGIGERIEATSPTTVSVAVVIDRDETLLGVISAIELAWTGKDRNYVT